VSGHFCRAERKSSSCYVRLRLLMYVCCKFKEVEDLQQNRNAEDRKGVRERRRRRARVEKRTHGFGMSDLIP